MINLVIKKFKIKVQKIQHYFTSVILSFYLPGKFNEQKVYVLTSSPRSGSTLLGQILDEIPDSCSLFEPLQLTHVPEAKQAGFLWRTDIAESKEWVSGKNFFQRIFEGRVINRWTTMEMTLAKSLKAKCMVVKFVRANRLLPWLCNNFSLPAPILLLRHPCAVVASQMSYDYSWSNIQRPEIPEYIKAYPKFVELIEQANTELEFLTIVWALDQLPVLLAQTPHPWMIVTYEDLVLQPETTLKRISNEWNVNINMEKALAKLKKPSTVVSTSGISGVSGWQKKLTPEQITTILHIVHGFGLSFYTEQNSIDYEKLYDEQLAEQIKQVGC